MDEETYHKMARGVLPEVEGYDQKKKLRMAALNRKIMIEKLNSKLRMNTIESFRETRKD